MIRTKSKIFSAVMSVAFLGSLSKLQAQTQIAPPVNQVPPQGFLSFEGGMALTQDTIIHDTDGSRKFSFDTGLRFDLRAGANSPRGWGFDLDVGVIYSPFKGNPLSDIGSLDYYEIPMMLDITYTLPRLGPFKAYIGAGIGAVCSVFTGYGTSLLGFDTEYTFGYQGTAGIRYSLSEHWDIGIAYKFLGTTEHDLGSGVSMDGTLTHSFLAAMTYKF